jgi:hypothetical protein
MEPVRQGEREAEAARSEDDVASTCGEGAQDLPGQPDSTPFSAGVLFHDVAELRLGCVARTDAEQ